MNFEQLNQNQNAFILYFRTDRKSPPDCFKLLGKNISEEACKWISPEEEYFKYVEKLYSKLIDIQLDQLEIC